jgi:hypothetical protein
MQDQFLSEQILRVLNKIEYNTKNFRELYPQTCPVLFLSSTETQTESQTPYNFIPNTPDGYLTELEELGQASVSPGTTSKSETGNNPYSIYQRCLSDISPIINAQNVMLHKLEWFAFDTTQNPAGTGQDQAVITEIINSRTTDKILAQSNYNNALLPVVSQPNGFRPQILINGKPVLLGLQSSSYENPTTKDKNNLGDLSIGFPIPYTYCVDQELGKVQTIQSFGQVYQIVNDGSDNLYQRYPVLTIATFWLGSSNKAV